MVTTLNKIVYKAFGLIMMSDIRLPELPEIIDKQQDVIDIVIELADLTELWKEFAEPNRHFVVKENIVLFQISNTAIYLIEEGKRIVVSPLHDADEDHVRLYVLGTCMGALLQQRKVLPLHGSAIAIDGKAYAIVGDSGAGKSTLASAF